MDRYIYNGQKFDYSNVLNDKEEEQKSQIPSSLSIGKILVFVNPASGKGYAQKIWQDALTVLSKTGHEFKVVNTQYQGHCKEYINLLPIEQLKQYKSIVLVSGDGLPHEAINGIYTRKDWKEVIDIPIGVLPGGSGNAFAKTVCFTSKVESGVINAAIIIAKVKQRFLFNEGQTKDIDLVLFQTEQGQKVFSFLSLSWAFISDVDLGSEGMRFLGETRFTVYGTWRAIFQKKYAGNFYYSQAQVDDDVVSALVNSQEQNFIPDIKIKMEDFLKQQNQNGIWVDEGQRDFTYFLVSKQPYISESYYAAPLCKIDDGLMDIQYLYSQDGWSSLVSLALSQEDGNHIDMQTQNVKNNKLKYKKVSAFRLEPLTQKSPFSIDGEQYPAQKIQGIVLKKSLKVLCQ